MKSILLYANEDPGFEARLQAALDVGRLFGAHLTCLQVTPYDSFIMSDPFGGVYALPNVVGEVARREEDFRQRVAARLAGEDVSWDWDHGEGNPPEVVLEQARLADLIVVSLPAAGAEGPLPIAADVAIHARSPVLAVPQDCRGLDGRGDAIVAWNGAFEAAHALRLSLPMLARASAVHVVTVADDRTDFPATDASQYLARHGIASTLHEWPRSNRSTADALIDAARTLGGDYLVMGAYGHSRIRESVLGGTTRDMLRDSPLPVLLGH